ncbi:unnamed protein product [Amoebophrya sp. A25]|nr:unnamed protein product [Amoebophrya sp. A25]|eukprot:GSA25T00005445001.1
MKAAMRDEDAGAGLHHAAHEVSLLDGSMDTAQRKDEVATMMSARSDSEKPTPTETIEGELGATSSGASNCAAAAPASVADVSCCAASVNVSVPVPVDPLLVQQQFGGSSSSTAAPPTAEPEYLLPPGCAPLNGVAPPVGTTATRDGRVDPHEGVIDFNAPATCSSSNAAGNFGDGFLAAFNAGAASSSGPVGNNHMGPTTSVGSGYYHGSNLHSPRLSESSLGTSSMYNMNMELYPHGAEPRAEMELHLKIKLQTMVSRRFEDYIEIVDTVQNEREGTLRYLDCRLLTANPSKSGISIAVQKESRFLVYVNNNAPSTVFVSTRQPGNSEFDDVPTRLQEPVPLRHIPNGKLLPHLPVAPAATGAIGGALISHATGHFADPGVPPMVSSTSSHGGTYSPPPGSLVVEPPRRPPGASGLDSNAQSPAMASSSASSSAVKSPRTLQEEEGMRCALELNLKEEIDPGESLYLDIQEPSSSKRRAAGAAKSPITRVTGEQVEGSKLLSDNSSPRRGGGASRTLSLDVNLSRKASVDEELLQMSSKISDPKPMAASSSSSAPQAVSDGESRASSPKSSPSKRGAKRSTQQALQLWAEQVNTFGQSGSCQSLSALLEHGYLVWKKYLKEDLVRSSSTQSTKNKKTPGAFGLNGCFGHQAANQAYEEADRAYNREDFQKAVDVCSEALRAERTLKSTNPQIYRKLLRLRCEAFFHAEKYQMCLSDVEKLLGMDNTDGMLYYRQGMALKIMGRPERALEAIMTAMEYEPQNILIEEGFAVIFEEASRVISSGRPKQDETTTRSPRARRSGGRGGVNVARLSAAALETLSSTTQATRLSSQSTTPSPSNDTRSSSVDKAVLEGLDEA